MNAKAKNYNSIVFLTTLSVYLGLVLVGATPQVLAQQAEIISGHAKIAKNKSSSQNKLKEDNCTELSIGAAVELLAKYDINLPPVNFSYKVDFQENPVKLQFLKTEGDKLFINSLLKNFTCTINYLKAIEATELREKSQGKFSGFSIRGFFPYLNAFYNYKVNNQEINAAVTYTFSTVEGAKSVAARLQQNTDDQNRISKNEDLVNKDQLIGAIYSNTIIRSENNQVFIITRLPRGSLDALLAKSAQ